MFGHLVAIQAYRMEATISFTPIPVVVSLVLAIMGCSYGIYVAIMSGQIPPEVGGVAIGMTVAAMQYGNLVAINADGGAFYWNADLMFALAPLAIAIMALAIGQAVGDRLRHTWMMVPLLMMLAVLGLHFSAMAGVQTPEGEPGLVSPSVPPAFATAMFAAGIFAIVACVVQIVRARGHSRIR